MLSFEKVLEAIPERVRMRLAPVTFEPGETIIEKGAPVTCGYIFTEGVFDVQSVNTRGIAYTYVTNYEARFVGLMEIFSDHHRYCCTLKVDERCRGYRITREDLFILLSDCDPFKEYLICYWANQFYESSINESRYPTNSMNIKLIDYLLRLCDALKPSGDVIRIKIKREELAAFMGCSRRTVYRLLSQFKNEGLIGKEGNTLTITADQRKKLQKKREE